MRIILTLCLILSRLTAVNAQDLSQLKKLWQDPTQEYRMKTWWFFGYERTSDEGIIADVEALRDAGFGGVVYYDQNHAKDARANGAEDAFSTEWWRHLYLAASEAKQAGLSFELNISNGYCAGGRWIDPEHANIIDSYIASLSDNDQQLMQLYLEGYNADEIGQKIGTSRDAVYQRMHRAIKKMRYTVLILVLLITAGATAIAVVPQWDMIFSNKWGGLWHGNENKDEDEDEKACGTKTKTGTTLDENDDKNENEPPTSVTNAKITSIERLPVIDISQLLPSSDTIYVPAADSKLALSINGDNIIITGNTGETVRIYDMSGNLVASGVADGLCILDPFPKHSLVLHLTDYYFRLQIGNREEILLVL